MRRLGLGKSAVFAGREKTVPNSRGRQSTTRGDGATVDVEASRGSNEHRASNRTDATSATTRDVVDDDDDDDDESQSLNRNR